MTKERYLWSLLILALAVGLVSSAGRPSSGAAAEDVQATATPVEPGDAAQATATAAATIEPGDADQQTATDAASIEPLDLAQAEIQDWPQLGRNPQRWHYFPSTIENPPFGMKWSKALTDFGVQHRLYASAQVIYAAGKAFIGSKSGTLFAMDAQTGNLAWEFPTGGPILHTAGYENGRVFAAAMDGHVYAVDAGTGQKIWEFSNNRRFGFVGAVLLAESRVFAVDSGGYLYALSQGDGSELWHYDAGAPVVCTPSYNNGRVFFGSEDMRVHAVNASTGARVWRSEQIEGQSFIDYWPVIVNGKVIVSVMTGLEPMESLRNPDPPINGLNALDENTGAILPAPPHYLLGSMNGPHSPPAVTADGLLTVGWLIGTNAWGGSGWALVDPRTNQMVQILNSAPETVGTGAPDETMIAGVWGDTILVNHHSGFLWANPSHQSASYDRRTRVWTDWPREGEETRWDVGAYGYVNSQAGGVNAISGIHTLLFHQAADVVTAYAP